MQARRGATLFVTTIWNNHSDKDQKGQRTPTKKLAIVKNPTNGTFWYRVKKPKANTKKEILAVAHWNGIHLALRNGTPILGVLKDAHSDRCSVKHIFDCDTPRYESDGNAVWLQIHPRGDVGCEAREANVREAKVLQYDY